MIDYRRKYYDQLKENRKYRKELWKQIQENESIKKILKKQDETINILIRQIQRGEQKK